MLGWANSGSQLRLHGDPSGLDREPSLGSLVWAPQTGWAGSATNDAEEDVHDQPHDGELDLGEEGDDNGIADRDA